MVLMILRFRSIAWARKLRYRFTSCRVGEKAASMGAPSSPKSAFGWHFWSPTVANNKRLHRPFPLFLSTRFDRCLEVLFDRHIPRRPLLGEMVTTRSGTLEPPMGPSRMSGHTSTIRDRVLVIFP